MNQDLKSFTLDQLKVMSWDLINQSEALQSKLNIINTEIHSRKIMESETTPEVTEETPPEVTPEA